ncbi:MAG: peptidoglycan-binding protein [Bacteroidetes bacterium]|nr:MAG: peptidoglycan-binding protein [Bacteroidota bacterium]
MALTKLQIQAYSDVKFSSKVGSALKVAINPSSYKHDYEISYEEADTIGQTVKGAKFAGMGAESVSFTLIFDETGAIKSTSGEGGASGGAGKAVAKEIKAFREAIFSYNGSAHQPNYVKITWGTMIFNGRLTTMSINYKMFKPNGNPLRAEIEVAFQGATDAAAAALEANASSPDMSHLVTTKSGDLLPLICQNIYKDPSMYLEVAKINGLVSFRNVKPDTTIYFPPIKK